ncbi:MAG: hypothetical protein AAFQ68_12570 [Bacteroidota bacterium]
MSQAIGLHTEAMSIAERAFIARMRGQAVEAKALFLEACQLEKQAALATDIDAHTSRAVLMRSAASLAINAEDWREAEKIAGRALSEDPPLEIIDELRDLLDRAQFHLEAAIAEDMDTADAQDIEIVGRLSYADASQRHIRLTDQDGNPLPYQISVPHNLSGIVRDHWQDTILIKGLTHTNSHRVLMQEIRKIG